MRGKLWFALGAAAGFVLGARAGREKYEDMVMRARKVWDHPTVQEAAGVVQAQANRLFNEGKDTVSEKLSHTRLGERMSTSSTTGDETLAGAPAGGPATIGGLDEETRSTPTGSTPSMGTTY